MRGTVRVARPAAYAVAACLLALVASGCASAPLRPQSEEATTSVPELGSCHVLEPADVTAPSSDKAPVDCAEPHTAQTFAIGTLPDETGEDYADQGHGRWIYDTCQGSFERFLGIDESQAMRVQLSWAWFRPSEAAWADGARWYRCDVVGGPAEASAYRPLPETAEGLFSARPPEKWLTCARGATVSGSPKVPCSEDHDWRAVTTIKLGQPADEYPGDRVVQVRSRDFCSDSVAGWLSYPVEYDYGYTWFGEAEWQAGNRRSVCWAKVT